MPAIKDIKFENSILGKTLEEAKVLAEAKGYIISTRQLEDQQLAGTQEVRNNRVDVRVKNGVIDSIVKWG